MSRLSREKKREEKRAVPSAAPVVAPLDVRVPDNRPGAGGASVGGVPVVPAPGQEIQHAVLAHLHRIALAAGHPVLADIHDERIGYAVPLRMNPDGSTHFTAEPTRMPPAGDQGAAGTPGERTAPPAATAPPARPESSAPPAPPVQAPRGDLPTHLLRATPEPVRDATPTFPLRSLGEAETGAGTRPEPTTFPLRAVPESAEGVASSGTTAASGAVSAEDAVAPGTVSAPTGAFGPPPAMDLRPEPALSADVAPAPAPVADVTPQRDPKPLIDMTAEPEPEPKPTPARGFDAIAEAVLGDDPRTAPGDGSAPALLAEPVARINEAVKAGRTEAAAHLAEQTVAEASVTLGPEHPEVLRLRELTAYIAYLAGDPLRAFHLSLDLARIHRRTRDAEAAYGNVQSAASAWRAVRNPVQGLSLGYDLIGLWTELVAEGGPAADDLDQLESARTRMGRLAERARDAGVR